jgi:hypothetical protein
MAFIQKAIPPANRILTFSLSDFAGGLNNRSEILNNNEAQDLINVKFMNDNVMEKRNGIEHYDGQVLDAPVTFIDEFKPYTDTDILLRGTSAKLYAGSTLIKNVAGQIDGVNFSGKYFFVDGGELYVYGKFPQTDALPYTDVIGTPINDYTVMKVITPLAGFTPLDTSYIRGVTRYDYTNGVIYYEPCQNEMTDTSKGANVLPQVPSFITVRKGRLFISGSNKDNDNVFISDVQNPYYYPVTLPVQLPPNSDKVTAITVYDDSVVIGRKHDLYVITGETNNPQLGFELFTLRRINSHTGVINNRAINVAHNYLFYLGTDGNAYSLASTRNDQKILATSIISQTLDLFAAPLSFTQIQIDDARGYFFKDEWHLSIADKVLVYSYRHRAWTVYNHHNARSFYNLNEKLIWGTDSGYVDTYSDDYLDYGIPYRAFWTSKNLDMNDTSSYKQFRECYIVAHTYQDFASMIDVAFGIDYGEVTGVATIGDQISVYGRAKWGSRFISRNIVQSLPFVIGRRARFITFTISNGYDPQGTVNTADDLINYLGRKDGSLVYVTDESAYYLFDGTIWTKMADQDINQPMRWYQMNGEYEFRGKR